MDGIWRIVAIVVEMLVEVSFLCFFLSNLPLTFKHKVRSPVSALSFADLFTLRIIPIKNIPNRLLSCSHYIPRTRTLVSIATRS